MIKIRVLLFMVPQVRLGGNFLNDRALSRTRQAAQRVTGPDGRRENSLARKTLAEGSSSSHRYRWWSKNRDNDNNRDDDFSSSSLSGDLDDLDVDALFAEEEDEALTVKPLEIVEEHREAPRSKEHSRAPSLEGDDEEEEREAFEATMNGVQVLENTDAIGAGGEDEEDTLENLDMSSSEKEEHEKEHGVESSKNKSSKNDDDDVVKGDWFEETLGDAASIARIQKLKKLIKPKKMRVFLSLKALSPGCRYLADGLGNVERDERDEAQSFSHQQGHGYGTLVLTDNGVDKNVQQQKQTIIYDANGEPLTKKPSGSSVAKEIAQSAGSGTFKRRQLLSFDDNTNITPEEEAENAKVSPNKCRIRWSSGRDGKEMSTTPMEFNMLHVARKQALELETQFLPRIPRRDYDQTYNTCAVVANGGVHLRALKGKEIDEHDAVFRINYAPVSGKSSATKNDYSKHVGSRTTFDVVNRPNSDALLRGGHIWRKPERQPGVSGFNSKNTPSKPRRIAALILGEPLIRDARREQFLPLMRANKDKEIYLTTPETTYTFRYVWHELKKVVEQRNPGAKYNDKPMTGWTTVMLAVQLCENVSLYGFQPFKGTSQDDRYHYFDRVSASLKVHSFDLAFEVFKLLKSFNVTLVDPKTDADFVARVQ